MVDASAVKRVGEYVKLRVCWGDVPNPGDMLQLPSGRRYFVRAVRGKTLHTIVAPADAEFSGRLLAWEWAKKKKKKRARISSR